MNGVLKVLHSELVMVIYHQRALSLSLSPSPSLSLLLSSASSPSPKAGGITLAIDLFNAALCRPDVIKSNHQFNIFADELPRRLVSPAPSCNCCLRFPERIANLIAINKE